MRRLWCVLLGALVLGVWTDVPAKGKGAGGTVQVRGYFRKDGTYVAPHTRSAPGNANDGSGFVPGTGVTLPAIGTQKPATIGVSPAPPGVVPPTQEPSNLPEILPVRADDRQPQAASSGSPVGTEVKRRPELKLPLEFSARKGWQIANPPRGTSLDQSLSLIGMVGVACAVRAYCPCRPVTIALPMSRGETAADRAVFFSAINRVSENLEVWGYPTISECASAQKTMVDLYGSDYSDVSACAIAKAPQANVSAQQPSYEEIAQKPSERAALLRTTFKHACYTGCSMAQVDLPKVPQEDELLGRGFLSCDGRLINDPNLIEDDRLLSTTCGYAVGVMFAKYGLVREIVDEANQPAFSPRAISAFKRCLRELARQKIPGAEAELMNFERETKGKAGRR